MGLTNQEPERGEARNRRLQDLLVYPHESLDVELKAWLDLSDQGDRANLAQAILALANYGGGFVILGYQESAGQWHPATPHPADLTSYSQDQINGVVQRFAEPAFHCPVAHVPHPDSRLLYPIVEVPGNHQVPIRAKRDGPNHAHVAMNAYYTRRPGPSSEPIQTATEWDELIQRCVRADRERLIEEIRRIVIGSPEATTASQPLSDRVEAWQDDAFQRLNLLVEGEENVPSNLYEHGTWSASYALASLSTQPSLAQLRQILEDVKGRETGWPEWWVPTRPEIEPYPFNGLLECWMGRQETMRDSSHADFWRASPEGLLVLIRGYQEDQDYQSPNRYSPGAALDFLLPVWRVGECLLHAERLAAEIGAPGATIAFRFVWDGLEGRELVALTRPADYYLDRHVCRQARVVSGLEVDPQGISTSLPELVSRITSPLYDAFGLFQMPAVTIDHELSRMRRRAI